MREDTKIEERVTAVVAVRPFGDADELLLAWGISIGWRNRTRYW